MPRGARNWRLEKLAGRARRGSALPIAAQRQAELYREATATEGAALPDPLRFGPPSMTDIAEGVEAIEGLCALSRRRVKDVGDAWRAPFPNLEWFPAHLLREVGGLGPLPESIPDEHVDDPLNDWSMIPPWDDVALL